MTYAITDNHTLSGAHQLTTPNVGGGIVPKFVVIRTFSDTGQNVVLGMQNESLKRSTHLLLANKAVYQLLPFTTKSWGVGASYWKGHTDLNSVSVTIGICPDLEGSFSWAHRHLDEILPLLVDKYRIREIMGRGRVLVAPGVSSDPHESFDLRAMQEYAIFDNAGGEGQYVTVMEGVHVYAGDNPCFPVLTKLNRGESVKVLRFYNGWALIAYDKLRGYVPEGFLMKS